MNCLKSKIFRYYVAAVTCIATLAIFSGIMWQFTDKDALEIAVLWAMYCYIPSFGLPLIIMEAMDEDERDED